ncbi:MAG: archease [Candidatus Aenigmarchaeota archaeon]|nr:archease [Candidatus Aenigmarchaeota archaeon]
MSYQYHEGVTLADIAFSVEAKSPENLMVDGAKATFESMVDLKEVKPSKAMEIKLEAASMEKLFFEWIEELIYLKDSEEMAFSKFEVKITSGQKYFLKGKAFGEKISIKHNQKVDVKAITYHQFSVKKAGKGWKAFVVLDV